MSAPEDDEFAFSRYTPKTDATVRIDRTVTQSNTERASEPVVVIVPVDAIVLNVYLKFAYEELAAFVNELEAPNEHLRSGNGGLVVSTLHQHALESTREPIDMSNQSVRTTYRPNLFTRKNDAFGPWNFNFLLTLLELDYERDEGNDRDFPKVWRTTSATTVRINRVRKAADNHNQSETQATANGEDTDNVTLAGLLKTICRQNKCDESDAKLWLQALKGRQSPLNVRDGFPRTFFRGEYRHHRASSASSGQ